MHLKKSPTFIIIGLSLLLIGLTCETKAQDEYTTFRRKLSWGVRIAGNSIEWYDSWSGFKTVDCWSGGYVCTGCDQTQLGCGYPYVSPPTGCDLRQGQVPYVGYSYNYCTAIEQVNYCGFSFGFHWIRDLDGCDCPLTPAAGASGYSPESNSYTEYIGYSPTAGMTGLITISPCEDSPDPYSDWLPSYGEQLCFQIHVSNPMRLEAIFKTSTYEGIAMNAPVPVGEPEQVKDIKAAQNNGWQLLETWWEADTACFKLRTTSTVQPAGDVFLSFAVLDYAAEGAMFVRNCQDTFLTADPYPYQIPYDFVSRFHSSADADGDGLTVWEEHRGFVNQNGTHFRTSPEAKEILVIDNAEVLVDNEIGSDFITSLEGMLDCDIVPCNVVTEPAVWEGWTFQQIDFMQGTYGADGLHPFNTPLVWPDPPYGRPLPWAGDIPSQQVAIVVDQSGNIGQEWGHCNHQPDFGICGNAGVGVLLAFISAQVEDWETYNNLPFGLKPQVRVLFKRKVLAHEFGHVVDICDHCLPLCVDNPNCDQFDGSVDCVLQNPFNHPANSSSAWGDWIDTYDNFDNWGYQNDAPFGCSGQILYRP
jgi:hypothetical protein